MNKKKLIAEFISKIVSNDETARETFSQICNIKAKDSVAPINPVILEAFNRTVLEYFTDEDPFTLGPGNTVLVKGKPVGRIVNQTVHPADDPKRGIRKGDADMDSGINFVSADGSFSKEFTDMQELFDFITQRYVGNK